MTALFPIGSKVTVKAKSQVPVAGDSGDHTGKTGKVRAYTDFAKEDVIHVIDLDEPMFVYLPGQSQFDPMTGNKLQGHQIDWIEVPASCLS